MKKGFKDFYNDYKDMICDYYDRHVEEDDIDTIISFIYEWEPEGLKNYNLVKIDYDSRIGPTVIEVDRDKFFFFKEDDTDSIEETPARELAATVMEGFEYFQDLNPDKFFEAEDIMTDIINQWFFIMEKNK